jgi:hypothetical protein
VLPKIKTQRTHEVWLAGVNQKRKSETVKARRYGRELEVFGASDIKAYLSALLLLYHPRFTSFQKQAWSIHMLLSCFEKPTDLSKITFAILHVFFFSKTQLLYSIGWRSALPSSSN